MMIDKKFAEILLTHVENHEYSYKELQQFSALFDQSIGFNIDNTESCLVENARELFPNGNAKSWGKSLFNGSEAWIGLAPNQLQTTYYEFYEAVKFINPKNGDVFCDLGAGYGRLGILIGLLFTENKFLGIEIVEDRVTEGLRIFNELKLSHSLLEVGTLGKISIPYAQYYFIYDFGSVVEINSVIELISENLKNGPVTIIARGRGVRSIIDNNHHWLTNIYQSRLDSFLIYSSSPK